MNMQGRVPEVFRWLLCFEMAAGKALTSAILLLAGLTIVAGFVFAQEGYVGAETCGACHADQFAGESQSKHANTLHRVSNLKLLDWVPNGSGVESDHPKAARFLFRKTPSEYLAVVTLGQDKIEIPIQWIFGAGSQGFTFFSRLSDGRFLEHRLSYYKRKKGFDITVGQPPGRSRTLEQAMGSLLPNDKALGCFNCHTTYVKSVPPGPDFTSVIPGIRCERCHGPGEAHLTAIASGASQSRIRNPGKLDGLKLVRMCGECHGDEEPTAGLIGSPSATRFPPVGLQASACFVMSAEAITCLTCHDPHEEMRRGDDAYYNDRCLACHGIHSTAQCPVNASDGCIGCHMPKATPDPFLTFTDHWIRVRSKPVLPAQ